MTKDVLVSIKGLQYSLEDAEGEDQRIETMNRGKYAFKNGHDIIAFDEYYDADVTVKNLIKFNDDFVEVNKKGPYNVTMLFEEGKKNFTNYNTPFGAISVGLDTESIKVERTPDAIDVYVTYNMEINGGFLARSEIEIHISSV